LREKSPLAKYQSVKANLIEGGIASQNFTFPLNSRVNFLDKSLKVAFHHPEEISEFCTILYIELAKKVVSVMNTIE
jgi:hypothetical protein